ncbi:MAG: hypothetical protein KUG78_18945 [Kangiellaceae bacterium]|nr:hypothetical protein [Kangiellaceae bacterium]
MPNKNRHWEKLHFKVPMKIKMFFILCYAIAGTCVASDVRTINALIKIDQSIDTSKLDSNFGIELGVITGGLFGTPSESPYWFKSFGDKKMISISLHDLEKDFMRLATPISKEKADLGVKILPKDTKLARVSTFGVLDDSGSVESGGFMDGEGNFLLLVYFDKQCQISGTITHASKPLTYDIKINKSGFHWIRGTVKQDSLELSSKLISNEVVLFVGEPRT